MESKKQPTNTTKKNTLLKRILMLSTAIALILIVGVFIIINVLDYKKKKDNKQNKGNNTEIISYEDFKKNFILFADKVNLLEDDDKKTIFTLQVPKGTEIDSLNVYINSSLIKTLSNQEITIGDNTVVRQKECQTFLFELESKFFRSDASYVFVSIDDECSNMVKLFRPLEMTEKEIELTYNVLCDLSDISNKIISSGKNFTKNDFYLPVIEYLDKSKDIVSFENHNGMIFFTMTNGETSFFSAEEPDGTFSSGGNTDNSHINSRYTEKQIDVKGNIDPYSYFNPSQNKTENITTIDPDVLVMAPLRDIENKSTASFNVAAANGDAEESLGKKIAQKLKQGTCDIRVDEECNIDVLSQWDEYGTILLNTHGPDDGKLLKYTDDYRKNNPSTYFFMGGIYEFSPIDHSFEDFLDLCSRWNILDAKSGVWYNVGAYKGIKVRYSNTIGIVYCDVILSSDGIMAVLNEANFENTVFVFNACNSLSDEIFNDFLLDRGASCVWGFTKSIDGFTSKSLISGLDEYFLGIKEKTDYSEYMNLIFETQNKKTVFDDINLECRRPADGIYYTYYGHTNLSGKVTDKVFSHPVEGVQINLYRYYDDEIQLVKHVKTDEKGKYLFEEQPYGIYMIEAVLNDKHTFVNFSIGGATEKVVNLQVEEFVPISNFDELMAISENLAGKYYLTNDIIMSDSYNPIGYTQKASFEGVFIGDGHIISNVSSPLFFDLQDANVMKLELVIKSSIDPTKWLKEKGNFGPLAVSVIRTEIFSCTTKGGVTITLSQDIGGNISGIAGHIEESTLKDCKSFISLDVKASNTLTRCGGIAGYSKDSNYIGCTNFGNIKLHNDINETSVFSSLFLQAGGICGSGSINLTECSNYGKISSIGGSFVGSRAGGFLGDGQCSAERSFNTGEVIAYMPTENNLNIIESIMQGNTSVGGKEEADALRSGIDNVNFMFWYDPPSGGYAGGFVGSGDCPSVKNCYNSGPVKGSYVAGGIIGKGYSVSVTNCVNTGGVTGSFCTGGFIGYLAQNYFVKSNFRSCYAVCDVGIAYICGPFAGVVDNSKMEIKNVYYSSSMDESLMIVSKESNYHMFEKCNGIESVFADKKFDFKNIWTNIDGKIGLKLKETH